MPKLDATEMAEQYGMSYAFFKSQPDLMRLLQQAVAEQWTNDRFQAALKSTNWWKDNSDSARQAQVEKSTDPATYQAKMSAASIQARDAAVQMGAILSGKSLQQLASNIINYNWTDQQIQNFLGSYVQFNGDHVLGGQAGAASDQIKQAAYDNGLQLSDQTVKNYAQYVVRGVSTMENVLAQIRHQAAGAFPAFAGQINAGTSVQDIAAPYIQTMARELGVADTGIKATDPKIKAALNRTNAQGQPEPMSLTDFTAQLRSDPAWRQTTDAVNQTMSVGRGVLKSMGLVS